eukprot:scaffold3426_cov145-Amphora_coffeaeformis.AAC.2
MSVLFFKIHIVLKIEVPSFSRSNLDILIHIRSFVSAGVFPSDFVSRSGGHDATQSGSKRTSQINPRQEKTTTTLRASVVVGVRSPPCCCTILSRKHFLLP